MAMPKIREVHDQIKVGDLVTTNGDGRDRSLEVFIHGVVGEKGKNFFYVFHNDARFDGNYYKVQPETYGYKYSWCIGLNSSANISFEGYFGEKKELSKEMERDLAIMNSPRTFYSTLTFEKINKPMSILNRLSSTVRKLLNPNLTAQFKAGYRNEDLSLSCKGHDVLLDLIAVDYEQKLADAATVALADEKAAKAEEQA